MKCPKCGSNHTQLTAIENDKKKHGFLWFILFGFWYWLFLLTIWMFKIVIGMMILMCWDWWMAIVKKTKNLGYSWKCKRFFAKVKKKHYYCHDCGTNFKN